MSNVTDYMLSLENDKEEALRVAQRTAQSLQINEVSLIAVVQSLGQYINDEDDKIRGRAVSYLTSILEALPPKHLSRQQIQVLCQFFCDRIEDAGAIDGLSRLQSLERFNNDMAQTAVRAIFEHFVDLQTRSQAGRYRILQLLNDLMNNYRPALQLMGEESIVGITDLVSGEKDPRNLMLIFSILRVIMVEWDIINQAETMFESVYAYFPITFRPPPNDPYGITAQDLKDRLRDCISSTKVLAPFAIPNLIDKLDSTSPVVKRDVFATIRACASTYDASSMSNYAIPLWDSVKYEVINAQEPELADEALLVLRDVAFCLSNNVDASDISSPIAQYLRPLNKECIEHLQEPAQRQAKASGDILKAVSSANATTFSLVFNAVIPSMLNIYESVDSIFKRRALLEICNQLFDSSLSVFGTWKSLEREECPLAPYKEKLLEIYRQAFMGTVKEEVSFRVTAAKGLLQLCKMCTLLADNEIGLVVQQFNDVVLIEESYGRDDLKRTAMESLAEVSKYKPRPIMDISFPAFMARLPDNDVEAETMNDYRTTLACLAEISVEREVFETLIRRLLNKLDSLLQTNNFSTPAYSCAILSTILYVMNRSTLLGATNLESYYGRVVVGLTQKLSSATSNTLTALNNDSAADLLGRIANLIIRYSSGDRQLHACENVYHLFSATDTLRSMTLSSVVSPISTSSILSTWLLAALPRDLEAPLFDSERVSQTCRLLVEILEQNPRPAVQMALLRQIALYINKHLSTANLRVGVEWLSQYYTSLRNTVDRTSDSHHYSTYIRLIFFMSKALILRLAPTTNTVLSDLLSLLDPQKYPPAACKMASSSFSALLAPDDVLSKTNHAQIRLLAPQRVFQTLTPLIASYFKQTSDTTEKEHYLVALSGVLLNVPSGIVVPELPTLLPLLLQSLDLSDQAVKIATLETFAVVIATTPAALEESGHIPALVKRLLKAAALPKHASTVDTAVNVPKARKLAVRCLCLMPAHIPDSSSKTNPLLMLKKEVLQGLMQVLDDPKRDVRKEAVDARSAWIRSVDDAQDDNDSD